MAELKKKATRESYGEALAELGRVSTDNLYRSRRRPCCGNKDRYIQEEIP